MTCSTLHRSPTSSTLGGGARVTVYPQSGRARSGRSHDDFTGTPQSLLLSPPPLSPPPLSLWDESPWVESPWVESPWDE